MLNRWVKYGVGVIIAFVLVVAVSIGIFLYQNYEVIRLIQQHKYLFTNTFVNSSEEELFGSFIQKIHNSPQILYTLRQNEIALQEAGRIVNIHNQELLYYETEVRFPARCPDDNLACESVRTALTAAQKNDGVANKLAFQYWATKSNNRSAPVDAVNAVFDLCLIADRYFEDGSNGFRGCKVLKEGIIRDAVFEEPNKDLSTDVQLYAIYRSIANNRYEYDLFEAISNRFSNDTQLRNIIQNDFESIEAFLRLPDTVRGAFDIDYHVYRKAQQFAGEYPWVMKNIVKADK